jgi:hypothetical protein
MLLFMSVKTNDCFEIVKQVKDVCAVKVNVSPYCIVSNLFVYFMILESELWCSKYIAICEMYMPYSDYLH